MSADNSKKKNKHHNSEKLDAKTYKKELERLQTELAIMQDWIKATGHRMVIVFEGRDAAGKGGMIRRITERVSSRVFRIVALPAPSDREKTQLYVQRYIQHLPAAGEIVLFDRSWYNRLGVERVMGFCSDKEYFQFIGNCTEFEQALVEDGIQVIKYWLTVSNKEQQKRFEARINDPMRQWKLSPMDTEARCRWFDYSRARDAMLDATDSAHAPWHIVRTDNKKRGRLNCISHLLSMVPYENIKREKVKLPDRDQSDQYDDVAALECRNFVPEKY
ncbi:MAG: polyphosphate kinase 2 [Pirellulaceae bacterium]|nr:polyphosphate kinase 2 [Pirellulaceae bacterium]